MSDSSTVSKTGIARTRRNLASSREVLTPNLLDEVAKDNERLLLPSWVKHAPRRPGETGHGKLSADEWRTLCTVNLVLTLGRLWGREKYPDSTSLAHLHNFYHLISLVQLGTQHSTSPERISTYNYHVKAYFSNLQELYPTASIVSNHHLLFHFGPILENWGPSPNWWAFPYERFNGMLQDVPTNSKFGEFHNHAVVSHTHSVLGQMESTLMNSFCMLGSIRQLCQAKNIPPGLEKFISIIQTQLEGSYTGSMNQDTVFSSQWLIHSAGRMCRLEPFLRRPFAMFTKQQGFTALSRSSQVELCSLSLRSHHYYAAADSKTNSQVLYEVDGRRCFGKISTMFVADVGAPTRLESVFIVVKQYRNLPEDDQHLNPFEKFPHLAVLVQSSFENRVHIIRPSNLICHCAALTPFEIGSRDDLTALVPFDRVSTKRAICITDS